MADEPGEGGRLFPRLAGVRGSGRGWLARYRGGQSVEVWTELVALGPVVREAAYFEEALAVARETMRRVRRNVETVRERLVRAGYQFEDPAGAFLPPAPSAPRMIEDVQARTGPMPLSLRAFYEEVGSVDLRQSVTQLVQHHRPERAAAPELLLLGEEDPLQVFPLNELHEQSKQSRRAIYFCFAADEFHKANYSGGENYHARLPDGAADFRIEGMYGVDEYFVGYLRETFRFGGFRGRIEVDEADPDVARKAGPGLAVCRELGRGLLPV